MSSHPGVGRVSSAKDKSSFMQSASATCLHALLAVDTWQRVPVEKVVAQAVDLSEGLWDDLKRRGYV